MAGKFETVGNFVARGAGKVDPALVDILRQAAEATGLNVEAYSGYRPGDKRQHGHGKATDIRIIGDDGKPLPNYQTPETFGAYETLAQAARKIQMEQYPQLDKQFRWGGYFSGGKGKYGAMDLMHFDLGGSDKLGMAGGSWEKGLTEQQAALFPGVKSAGALAFAGEAPRQSAGAVDAVNALADDQPRLQTNALAQNTQYVPPPFSGQRPTFAPLFNNEPIQPAQIAPAQKQIRQPTTAPQSNDDDLMKAWGLSSENATSASSVDSSNDDALMKAWGLDKTDVAPAAALPKADVEAPVAAAPIGLNDAVRSVATGVPVIGGLLNKANAATNALIAPVVNPLLSEGNQLKGETWEERYANSLAEQEGMDTAYAAQHPIASTVGNLAGGIAATIPMVAAAPALMGASRTASLGTNMLMGGATGAAIGGADSAVRSGGDLGETIRGAELGGAFGLGAPVAGKVIGATANKLVEGYRSMTPSGAAANNLSAAISESRTTPGAIANELASNPRLAPMDVDPNLQQMAMNLAARPGAPRSILYEAAQQRAGGAKGAVNEAFDQALGESPDTVKILSSLREKQQASVLKPEQVRATLDKTMGEAADPQSALDKFISQRSTESLPLYEKAFEGGSMAPLEKQFEGVFAEATESVSKASKELAAARQRQTLARAQESRAGNDVYSSSGALSAVRDADAATSAAEKNLAAATAQKESALSRLRQAQQDGTANAPGAVWSPRIQQFLDDPITQSGLARGVKIQRLESLAEGKVFNPTEYAITGVDAAGNPVVGSVPNMRTLNVVKKGLDEMVEAAKNPTTGRLSEEGVAIDKVRRAFLSELDSINSDYAAARGAWAGPSKAREAFTKGLGLFSNGTGKAALGNTPEQISTWIKKASPDELAALKLGARSSLEQQMANSANQIDRIAKLTDIEANQKKLAALIGDKEAKQIIDGMKAQFTDPVGDAFSRGLDILRTRTGSAGLEDRPEFWKQWFDGATAAEKEAAKQGARVAIDTQINAVRSAAAKGASIPDVGFNRDRLEILLGKAETDKLAQVLKDEQRIAQTNAKLFAGSQTAPRAVVNKLTEVTQVTPGISLTTPMAIGGGYSLGGLPGAAAGASLSLGRMGIQKGFQVRDVVRNKLMAEAISSGAGLENALASVGAGNRVGSKLQGSSSRLLSATGPAVNPLILGQERRRPLEITVKPRR